MSSEKPANKKELAIDHSKEIHQEKLLLERINKKLISKAKNLEQAKNELEKKLSGENHSTKELLQEQLFLNSINKKLQTKILESKVEKNEISKEKNTPEPHQQIDNLLRLYKKITVSRLAEFTDIDISEVQSYLKTLEVEGRVIQLQDRKEIVCTDCSSLNLEAIFYCPNCKNTNYKQITLIEHYDCGNVSPQETYTDDKCPQCHKLIGALGVDYRIIKNLFLCRNCDDKFPDPASIFQCQRCNTKFDITEANSKTSPLFQLK